MPVCIHQERYKSAFPKRGAVLTTTLRDPDSHKTKPPRLPPHPPSQPPHLSTTAHATAAHGCCIADSRRIQPRKRPCPAPYCTAAPALQPEDCLQQRMIEKRFYWAFKFNLTVQSRRGQILYLCCSTPATCGGQMPSLKGCKCVRFRVQTPYP